MAPSSFGPSADPGRFRAWLAGNPDIQGLLWVSTDLNGCGRGKRLPLSKLDAALGGAVKMPVSALGVDIWGRDCLTNGIVLETGDVDGMCLWTGRGPYPMPWSATPLALVPASMVTLEGSPFAGDPRQALAMILARYAARGWTPVVATELEFYLVDPAAKPAPQPPLLPGAHGARMAREGIYAIDELIAFDGFLNDLYAACRALEVPADTAIAENGTGQFEVNLKHRADALAAADDAQLFKTAARGVARAHGLAASFMAKPYGNRSGSGLHVHFSILDRDGRNIFDDGGAAGTAALRHAVAGLVAAMPESTLMLAPHANSYRRLRPDSHAPTAIAWGYENRTVAIRIPDSEPVNRRIEHRVAGADANPYLVLAALLGAALIGLEDQMAAPPPVAGNAYAQDLALLPSSWADAIAAFAAGAIVPRLFQDPLPRMLTAVKRQEMETFLGQIPALEIESYLEVV